MFLDLSNLARGSESHIANGSVIIRLLALPAIVDSKVFIFDMLIQQQSDCS